MKTKLQHVFAALALWLVLAMAPLVQAHVVPPEQFDPVVESYRRMMFLLNLNPVQWEEVKTDADGVATGLETISKQRADSYRATISNAISKCTPPVKEGEDAPGPEVRRETARLVFEASTRAMAELLSAELQELKAATGDRKKAAECLDKARKYWAAFEHEVKATDQQMFREIGFCWLKLTTALGSKPLLGAGETPVDAKTIQKESDEILAYVKDCYASFNAPAGRALVPAPLASKTFNASAVIPAKLPPGSNINKRRPRPRQILNMVNRGVNEIETPLVAFGDMTFDSPQIFGEPARSLGISCNSCHNKGTVNPEFKISGLSMYGGGLDVSSVFFAPHANNGVYDPLDTPDLRGIRFTAPYGRNGRFGSLRDFIRNVVVNEFNGPEPDPIVVDAMLAYMMEFDFLPNEHLNKDGSLNSKAPEAARRGEKLFNKPFAQMNGKSCASCHVPSSHFVDRLRHDIGSVKGAEDDSLDRAMDTPTLLSAKFTAPYFHDGSLATLKDVVQWFNRQYELKLNESQAADLTAYLETVGDGKEPFDESADAASPAEVEEQYFFMASWEFLRDKGKFELADLLFRTVAQELRNEKWGVKYGEASEVVEKMAQLTDAALAANKERKTEAVNASVLEFRKLYEANKSLINGEASPGAPEAAKTTAQTVPADRQTLADK